jgi:hypothetical protein
MIMSRFSFGRLGLLLVALLGLTALFSSTAFGAGKPTEVTAGAKYATITLNSFEQRAAANPNGAETTVTLEYREAGAATYQVAGTQNLGSGTSQLATYKLLKGVKPDGEYELRTKAVNSFGTVYSSVYLYESSYWYVTGTTGSHHSPFKSSGTANFEWTMGSTAIKISCNESGSGQLGGAWGTGNTYTPNLSKCVLYENGKEICKPNNSFFTVDQAFISTTGTIGMVFPEGCFYGEMTMNAKEAFTVEMPSFNKKALTQAMTLTNRLAWGSYPINLTISTTWSLTGEDSGKEFAAYQGL